MVSARPRNSSKTQDRSIVEVLGDTHYEWRGDDLLIEDEEVGSENEADEEPGSTRNRAIVKKTYYGAFRRIKEVKPPPRGNRGKGRGGQTKIDIFQIGDTVLTSILKNKKVYIGVIMSMWETRLEAGTPPKGFKDGGMYVRLHWFLRPEHRPTYAKKRDVLENEIFYTVDETVTVNPSEVNQLCTVSNPSKSSPTKQHQIEKNFVCSLALDSASDLYYDFDWSGHSKQARNSDPRDDQVWNVIVQSRAKRQRKVVERDEPPKKPAKRNEKWEKKEKKETELNDGGEEESGDEGSDFHASDDRESDSLEGSVVAEAESEAEVGGTENDYEDEDEGVKKKRKRAQSNDGPKTPRKKQKTKANGISQPTPHSKARLKKKRTKQLRTLAPHNSTSAARIRALPEDPLLRAMHVLHVGARPDTLPCREDQYAETMTAILNLLEENTGGCVYISGVPGTGKTATVHAIIQELKVMAENGDTNPFTYVEINGLKIPEPSVAYALLWEALSEHDVEKDGHMKISSKEALRQLNQYFSPAAKTGPGQHACVLLMDELDQLMTQKQDIIYNFFNWPNLAKSKLIVIAVANTHDLPERAMTGKVRSRLGMTRINFNPYTKDQLCTIVQSRLDSAKEGLDASKAKEVIAPDAIKLAATRIAGISGDARRILDICRRAVEFVRSSQGDQVTIAHINRVIKAMQSSPTAGYLQDCSLHERIMLAALIKCIKKEGVEEIRWGDLAHQHTLYTNILPAAGDPKRKLTQTELALVLDSLVASKAVLLEEGTASFRKAQGERKVILNVEMGEVERVLSEIGGKSWENALGVSLSSS